MLDRPWHAALLEGNNLVKLVPGVHNAAKSGVFELYFLFCLSWTHNSPSASGAKVSALLHLQIEHLELTSIDSKSTTESDLPTFPGETLALLLQCALEVRQISSSSSAITRFSIRFIRTSNASSVKNVEFCQRVVWFSVAIDLKLRNKSPSI